MTKDMPFRICFYVKPGDGEVCPLQQCNRWRFEEDHVVGVWDKDAEALRAMGWAGQLSNALDGLRRNTHGTGGRKLTKGCAKWFSERATDTYEPGWAVLQEKLLTVMRLDHVIMIRRRGKIPM